MDFGHQGIGFGGDDGVTAFLLAGFGISPFGKQSGKQQRLRIARIDIVGLFFLSDGLPLEEPAYGKEAGVRFPGVAEQGLFGEGFGAGVEAIDTELLGLRLAFAPMRDESPLHRGEVDVVVGGGGEHRQRGMGEAAEEKAGFRQDGLV